MEKPWIAVVVETVPQDFYEEVCTVTVKELSPKLFGNSRKNTFYAKTGFWGVNDYVLILPKNYAVPAAKFPMLYEMNFQIIYQKTYPEFVTPDVCFLRLNAEIFINGDKVETKYFLKNSNNLNGSELIFDPHDYNPEKVWI